MSIDLNGSEIDSIELTDACLRVVFSRAYLIKTMTGSAEKTRWWQAGALVIEGVEDAIQPPSGPQICRGGDVDDNIYTYRDMVPLPLATRGRVGCRLSFEGAQAQLVATGSSLRLVMEDVPKYIEHIREV